MWASRAMKYRGSSVGINTVFSGVETQSFAVAVIANLYEAANAMVVIVA
jgi:hypothetical protein